jgi:hypothetical protein
MLEFSISFEHLAIGLISTALIVFSFLAIFLKDLRLATISMVFAGLTTTSLIAIISDPILAIVLAGIYISTGGLILTLTNRIKQSHLSTKRWLAVAVLAFLSAFVLRYNSAGISNGISNMPQEHYAGIAGLGLIVAMLFVYAAFGVLSIFRKRS